MEAIPQLRCQCKEKCWFRTTKTKYSAQRRYICPRGPGDHDKGQRQEVEEEGEGEGNQGEGEEIKDCL